ncbi:DUF1934 domain-containing protein [Streptococcus sciuri]|uniref:DUF1934 domain-containing protein n=1 Tax=Streptococcus sciuri TaxID=2973939 RepID=A0ABT2F623_9STRE|nr:DUF1934 domain-containing protein [Streptococcus sciuri]MCS4487835.1 DUF1934 domain-containing protein [Streptococcus sciuri]
MQLTLNNEINLGDQTELIREVHTCDVIQKGGFYYLVYHNEENEKVVMKYNHEMMIMTRFSTPKSVMRFHHKEMAVGMIPTPMGVQHLTTKTKYYHLDVTKQTLAIHYTLTQESGTKFASYRLVISWV